MRKYIVAIGILLLAPSLRAQYTAPNTLWPGYHFKLGDTTRLERHVVLHVNNIIGGEVAPESDVFDERHAITVDSVDADGDLYIVDDVRSNSVVKTYTSGGTVTEQTGASNGWHQTLVFAKISRTGQFLGGNQYFGNSTIKALGDSVSMPRFRNDGRSQPTLGRTTLGNVLPVFGSRGVRPVGSKWQDTVVYNVRRDVYDMSVAPTGSAKPRVTTMWSRDTEVYSYETLATEMHKDIPCVKVRSVKHNSQPGASYEITTETTMWLDEKSGLPIEQEQHAVGKNSRFPNAGGEQDAHIVLGK